jgi:hypothetical protein
VINGTFDTASNWSNIAMGYPETVINSNIARVYDGVLVGSYIYNFISQTGTFPSPVRQVTFSYDMSNNNFNDGNRPQADGYRVEFRTYNAAGQRLNYYNTGDRADIFPWTHFAATYSLSDDAVRWDIGFRLVDNGYWNGNFAGSIDNVSLVASVTTTIPETTTYGETESAAVVSAQTALATAQLAYSSALNANQAAQARLSTALAAIPGLEAAILALTPTPEPTPTPTPTTVVEQPWWAQQNWEGETVTITAPAGWEFYSVRAWYGSPDDTTCGADVSSVLGGMMIGQTTITVALDNGTFGDPCGGVVKVTRFTWSIVPLQVVVPPVVTPPAIEPQPQPQPIPLPSPEPQPSPTPTETPVIIVPTPTPTEEPVAPTPEPTVDPEPTTPPVEEPAPAPAESSEPTPEPTEDVVEPLPEPEPSATPEVQPEPELPVTEEAAVGEIANLVETAPEDLTDAQVEQLVEAALVVFETAEQGSPAYEQALEALAVAAEADDAELSAELAAIPLLGDVAGAALEVFNNIGNVGADMAPAVREEAEKTVIASVIATGAAVNAVASATAAASTSTGSSGGGASGGSSGGSGSTRRKE